MAISKYDQFDFLIDIVPRDELKPHKTREEPAASKPSPNIPDQVQYYLQLAQQNQQALQQSTQQPQPTTLGNNTLLAGQQQSIQIIQGSNQIQTIGGVGVLPTTSLVQATPAAAVTNTTQSTNQQATQLVLQSLNLNSLTAQQQLQQQQQHQQHQQQQQQQQQQQSQQQQQQLGSGIQIVQQIVGPNGEIQQIPLQLSPQQLQMIRMQLGGNNGQQLILQSSHTAQPNQSE